MRRPARPQSIPGKRSKYRAIPTVIDGIRFASKKEARRYGELKLLEKAGEIRGLSLQPRYELCVANGDYPFNPKEPGRHVKLGEYRGDFLYEQRQPADEWGRDWVPVVEDVKGFKTPIYRWKKKHVEAQYGIEIREI